MAGTAVGAAAGGYRGATTTVSCIVLAGGSGRRMGGVDKAALRIGGRILLDRVLSAARPVADRLIVVGPSRTTTIEGVVFTAEANPGGGPVPAVAAGLELVGDAEAVLILAADLPLLRAGDLERLLAVLDGDPAGAVAASDDRGVANPLLAAHQVSGLRARLAGLGPDLAGTPAAALLPAGTLAVDLGALATFNVNRPEQLEWARARFTEADEEVVVEWPHAYAKALEEAAGDGLDLSDEQVEVVLDLARDVAHGTERRWAPVSTCLAGMYVARRVAEGVPVDEALSEALALARDLLAGEDRPDPA